MRKHAVLLLLGLWIAQGPGARGQTAAPIVRLAEWDGLATHHSGGGAGRDAFELTAVAEWAPGAAGSYAVRVVLPQGGVETQSIRKAGDRFPRRLTVYIPSAAVRNLRPASVVVRMSVIDPAGSVEISNALSATIADFPHPDPDPPTEPDAPFGWGRPLSATARQLPRPSPDGFRFVRITDDPRGAAVFVATTEASNAQVSRRLVGYDPRAGRSDEFLLEEPGQPALGLTPKQAESYLASLSRADPAGVVYRLPTASEWLRAARGGKPEGFWWRDEAARSASANFLGAEPVLEADTTAPAAPRPGSAGFLGNPWGIVHGFGNIAEWATSANGGFVRIGGHFRTEPEAPMEVAVDDPAATGPDPYVGVRPSFRMDAATGASIARRALARDPKLAAIRVSYDPFRATATLDGALADPLLRRQADQRLGPLWFLAAVENRLQTPTFAPGQLARIGSVVGPVRRIAPLGRSHYELPVEVRWNSPLPVSGSEWWVNVYSPAGGHSGHRMIAREPDRSRRLTVVVDPAQLPTAGGPVSVALSLGGPAEQPTSSGIVSNVASLTWKAP